MAQVSQPASANPIASLMGGNAPSVAQYLRDVLLPVHLSRAPRRVSAFVGILADMIDPRSKEDVLQLVFRRNPRKGNPGAKLDKEIKDHCIVRDADIVYRRYLDAGVPRRGLRKKVAGEIGEKYGVKGDPTVLILWRTARRYAKLTAGTKGESPQNSNAIVQRQSATPARRG